MAAGACDYPSKEERKASEEREVSGGGRGWGKEEGNRGAEPDSPLPDKGVGGRREPGTRGLKGAGGPFRRQRALGPRGQVSQPDRWGGAAFCPILPDGPRAPRPAVPGPTEDPRRWRAPSRPHGRPRPLRAGERAAGPAAARPTGPPTSLPSRGDWGGGLSGTPSRPSGEAELGYSVSVWDKARGSALGGWGAPGERVPGSGPKVSSSQKTGAGVLRGHRGTRGPGTALPLPRVVAQAFLCWRWDEGRHAWATPASQAPEAACPPSLYLGAPQIPLRGLGLNGRVGYHQHEANSSNAIIITPSSSTSPARAKRTSNHA